MESFDWSPLIGQWSESGRLLEIVRSGHEIVVHLAGVPEELSPRLEAPDPTGPVVVRGGPYHGVQVSTADIDGVAHLVLNGMVTLPRWDPAAPTPPVARLTLPVAEVPPETERAYQDLLARCRAAGGAAVDPPAAVALGAWVRWLTDQQAVLFHGSPDGGIDELLPRRTSYELNDQADRGNHGAVYATDDGWFAMWFAVVDRDRLRGSIRSTVEDFTTAGGASVPVYAFSVDHRELPKRPWRAGWLYLLGRETFEQLPALPGGPLSHEWCSTEAVRPLARVPLRPTDFPFLDRIGGHDDGDLLRHDDLAELVRARATGASRTDRGVVLRLAWDDELAAVSEEYLALSHKWIPEIDREFRRDADGVMCLHLEASRSAPQLAAMMQNSYAELLDR